MAQAAKQLRKTKDLAEAAAQEQREKEEEKIKKRNRSRDRRRKVWLSQETGEVTVFLTSISPPLSYLSFSISRAVSLSLHLLCQIGEESVTHV